MRRTLTKLLLISTLVTAWMPSMSLAATFIPVRPDQVPSGIEYSYTQPPIDNPYLLRGKRVAILASHGVEELEIIAPYNYLTSMGAQVDIVVPNWAAEGVVISRFLQPILFVKGNATFSQALKTNYDLLVLTGGAWNAQVVRSDIDALTLIVNHYNQGKPIGAICAGISVLINAGIAKGLTLTGSPVVRVDLENAGAHYIDQSLVISGTIATSRSPVDAADFVRGLRYILVGQ